MMFRPIPLRLTGIILIGLGFVSAVLLASVQTASAQDSFMLVSSRNTHSVKMYDGETGEYIRDFVAAGAGGLNTTQDIVWARDGHLLVTGRLTNEVLKFDGESGELIGAFSSGYELDNPTKLSFGPDGHLYVSQWGSRDGKLNVVRFDGETGEFIDEFTSDDPGLGTDHVWDADGNMYLAAFGARSVIKYAPDGSSQGAFTPPNSLQGPVNVWFDPNNGNMLVADWATGRIDRFDPESGEFIRSLVGEGSLENVEGFAYGPDGLLYAADWTNNTIKHFEARLGSDEGVFASGGGLQAPNAILFGPAPESQPTSTEEEKPDDLGFEISPNFPDPFRSETAIAFFVSAPAADATVNVYDLTGRLIQSNSMGSLASGRHRARISGRDLVPGVYLYRLNVGDRSRSGTAVRVE